MNLKTNPKKTDPAQSGDRCLCIDFPDPVDYEKAWDLQLKLVHARSQGIFENDVILMLEHPPVFTLGKRGGRENLKVDDAFLEQAGVSVVHVERGGDITYHGPGQLVIYPIVNLQRAKLKVLSFVYALEEIIIQVAGEWGIKAERNPINRGVWVGMKKLASIGIAIRRNVSFHGIALNVNLSMGPFSWIHPCGLHGIGMTSMQEELAFKVSMEQVRESVKGHIHEVLGFDLVMESLSALQDRL